MTWYLRVHRQVANKKILHIISPLRHIPQFHTWLLCCLQTIIINPFSNITKSETAKKKLDYVTIMDRYGHIWTYSLQQWFGLLDCGFSMVSPVVSPVLQRSSRAALQHLQRLRGAAGAELLRQRRGPQQLRRCHRRRRSWWRAKTKKMWQSHGIMGTEKDLSTSKCICLA